MPGFAMGGLQEGVEASRAERCGGGKRGTSGWCAQMGALALISSARIVQRARAQQCRGSLASLLRPAYYS